MPSQSFARRAFAIAVAYALISVLYPPRHDATAAELEPDDAAQTTALIRQLGARSHAQREEATRLLEQRAETAFDEICQAARFDPDLEVRSRASIIAQRISQRLFAEAGDFNARRSESHNDHLRATTSGDGKWLLTAGTRGLQAWDTERGKFVCSVGSELGMGMNVLAMSADGRMSAAQSGTRGVRVRNTRSGEVVKGFHSLPDRPVGLWFLADGKTVLGLCEDGTVFRLDLATLEVSQEKAAPRTVCAAYRCGHPLFVVNQELDGGRATLALLSPDSFRVLATIDAVANGLITRCSLAPDGKLLAIVEKNMGVHLVDVVARKKTLSVVHGRAIDACFTADSRNLITVGDSDETSIRIWNANTGVLHHRRESTSPFLTVNVLAGDGRILTTHRDGEIRVWKLKQ
jgi:WD40 repeat protein